MVRFSGNSTVRCSEAENISHEKENIGLMNGRVYLSTTYAWGWWCSFEYFLKRFY